MDKDVEARGGYKAIDILAKQIEEYIKSFTINGKYSGEWDYIIRHQKLLNYLKTD